MDSRCRFFPRQKPPARLLRVYDHSIRCMAVGNRTRCGLCTGERPEDAKSVPTRAIPWLRDDRRFHLAVTVRPTRAIFVGGAGSSLVRAREFAAEAVAQSKANPQVEDITRKRLQQLQQASQSNSLNVRLLGDLWLLSVFFAAITVLIGRERPSRIVGWFPDRDDMTNWCDRVWHEFGFWNTRLSLTPSTSICERRKL